MDELYELADQIRQLMTEHGWRLSTAESCTSGRIAATLTRVSGASQYFQGGLVAYQDRIKVRMLDVPMEMIEQYDVVSQPVVEAMVRGACHLLLTDFAVASTGYAGEGANGIPQGTIWIGWGKAGDVHSLCLHEDKEKTQRMNATERREENTANAVRQVLRQLADYLNKKS